MSVNNKNIGVPLENQGAEIEKIATLKPEQMRRINETVAVNEDFKISWTDYKKLENFIIDLLKTGDNYESSLKSAAKFLRIVLEGLQKRKEISGILEKIDKKILFVRIDHRGKKENNDTFSKKTTAILCFLWGMSLSAGQRFQFLRSIATFVKLIFKKGTLDLNGKNLMFPCVYQTHFNIENKENMKLIKNILSI